MFDDIIHICRNELLLCFNNELASGASECFMQLVMHATFIFLIKSQFCVTFYFYKKFFRWGHKVFVFVSLDKWYSWWEVIDMRVSSSPLVELTGTKGKKCISKINQTFNHSKMIEENHHHHCWHMAWVQVLRRNALFLMVSTAFHSEQPELDIYHFPIMSLDGFIQHV